MALSHRLALAALVACAPDTGIGDPCTVAGDCRAGTHCDEGICVEGCLPPSPPYTLDLRPTRRVTLLFVIDDTGSMSEEQASLAAALPRLVQGLAEGNPGGRRFRPPEDVRFGVITTDMGTGPAGACGSISGDDGVLQTAGDRGDPACEPNYPTWLDFGALLGSEDSVTAARCVLGALGIGGCGFEQQLEATLKALTPSISGITFADGFVGHGDGQNAGFVALESVLAIVTLTDEDDCSTADPALFDEVSRTYEPGLNLRCFHHPEVLHPIERYVDGLMELPTRGLVYAPIVGIPVDLEPDPDRPLAPQLDAVLEDERMVERPRPDDGTQLTPSCDEPGRGRAYPPRRIVELTAALERRGASVALGSICQESLAKPIDVLLDAIGDALPLVCVPHPLERTAGLVDCDVVEYLDPAGGLTCADLPGRADAGVSDFGWPSCLVTQLPTAGAPPEEEGAGWFYDDFSEAVRTRCGDTPQQIAFTPGAEPAPGSRVAVDCTDPRPPQWGSACGRDPARCADAMVPAWFPGGLGCHAVSATCQPLCASDADCPGGYTCSTAGTCGDFTCL